MLLFKKNEPYTHFYIHICIYIFAYTYLHLCVYVFTSADWDVGTHQPVMAMVCLYPLSKRFNMVVPNRLWMLYIKQYVVEHISLLYLIQGWERMI